MPQDKRAKVPLSRTAETALAEVRQRFPLISPARIRKTALELGMVELATVPTLLPEATARALGWLRS